MVVVPVATEWLQIATDVTLADARSSTHRQRGWIAVAVILRVQEKLTLPAIVTTSLKVPNPTSNN